MKFLFFFLALECLRQEGNTQELLQNRHFRYPVIPYNHTYVTVHTGLVYNWFYNTPVMIVGIPYGSFQNRAMNMPQALMLTTEQKLYQEFNLADYVNENRVYNCTFSAEYYSPPNETESFILIIIPNICSLYVGDIQPASVLRTIQTHCILRFQRYRVEIEGYRFLRPLLDSFKIMSVSLRINYALDLHPVDENHKKKRESKMQIQFHN